MHVFSVISSKARVGKTAAPACRPMPADPLPLPRQARRLAVDGARSGPRAGIRSPVRATGSGTQPDGMASSRLGHDVAPRPCGPCRSCL